MKIQIRGLEAAACSLVHLLDRLLVDERGFHLLYPGEGMHIHRPEPVPMTGAVRVAIRPIGWPPEALIEAQFMSTVTGWKLCGDGRIVAPHLSPMYDDITFSPLTYGIGLRLNLPSEKRDTILKNTVARIVRSLRQSLD